MYTREQIEQSLKEKAKDSMFERDFQQSFNKYLTDKQQNPNRKYSETVNADDYRLKDCEVTTPQHPPFEIPNDDEFKSKKWTSLLKDSAFYFDLPTIQEEREMRWTI